MNHQIIAAAIVGASVLIASAMLVYFGPYQSCMRTLEAFDPNIRDMSRVAVCIGKN